MDSLLAVAHQIESGQLSPVEVTDELLQRIEGLDPQLHSYTTVLADSARRHAQRAEDEIRSGRYRGPLHGIPIAVKDLCLTKGVRTTCGSPLLDQWIPDVDATVVLKLAEAGAILIGKTHMTEFAFRWHRTDQPQPLNPWNSARGPGVSSSGSGVAVAGGLCYGALGTDTGGSIRFPAACNGVVGLKPTFGRVSRHGVFPLSETLDNVGPLARRVGDAAAILYAIAGPDRADPTAYRKPPPDYLATLEDGVQGIRLGVDEKFITHEVDAEVSTAVFEAIETLTRLGAQVVDVSVPAIEATIPNWFIICYSDALDAHRATYPSRADEYGPFRQILDEGIKHTGQEYAKAHILRERFSAQLQSVFDQADILVCPTMPHVAPPLGADGQPVETVSTRVRFTYPFNFSRNPTLSVPCGLNRDRMPMSLQLVGRHFDEALLCRAGHAYEQATAWHTMEPPTL